MNPLRLIPYLIFFGCTLRVGVLAAEPTPTAQAPSLAAPPVVRVVVLANSADSDSLALARYYADRRGVPLANIISLPLSLAEGITREEFERTLYQPLQDELVRRGWITGLEYSTNGAPVPARRKYAMLGHKISYLVVCRGVPLSVQNDARLPIDSKISTSGPVFSTNAAAVDSELAMLAQSGWPLSGFVPNPLFHKENPISLTTEQVVKVGRLDGPTVTDARRLVDLAISAEETGLIGRSYVDIGGPHADGDKWLEATAKELVALGFDGDVDREPKSMPVEARFDAPVLYFGWYEGAVHGPFERAGFKFPPGAIALHIYSYSASTMRSTTAWTPGLVARGVTATVGNVAEPYLQFTHQPQLLLESLARGESLGDAAAYSLVGYSWMAILVGDPLYRPFGKTFDDQWRDRAKLSAEQQGYLLVRRMHQLDQANRFNEAVATGTVAQTESYRLVVALTLADLLRAHGDSGGAKRALESAVRLEVPLQPSETALLANVARQFTSLSESVLALRAWQRLLAGQEPRDVRLAWLKAAIPAARAAKNEALAQRWEAEVK